MSGKSVMLKQFSHSELILSEEETKEVLKFIFKGFVGEGQIDKLRITDTVRGFAQGLLIEAIDASYALGFVEAIFSASANPTAGAKKVLKSFGKKALKHWFKHATAENLMEVKIYEIVRNVLARNFKTELQLMINGLAQAKKRYIAYIDYDALVASTKIA